MRSILLILIFLISCRTVPAQAQAVPPAPVGLQLGTFKRQLADDLHGTLRRIRELGIRSLETGTVAGRSAEATRRLLDSFDLRVDATGADYGTLADPARLSEVIGKAKGLGARVVVCYWIPHEEGSFTDADVRQAARVFNTAGKALRAQGLRLLYHPHGYEFGSAGDGEVMFDRLVRETDPRYVNFQMDIFWIKNPGQDPVYWLRKYPRRWKSMHLKDRRPGTPVNPNGRADKESNVPIGSGELDMPAIMRQGRKLGIRYYFIEDESSRSWEQVPVSVEYLSRGLSNPRVKKNQ